MEKWTPPTYGPRPFVPFAKQVFTVEPYVSDAAKSSDSVAGRLPQL